MLAAGDRTYQRGKRKAGTHMEKYRLIAEFLNGTRHKVGEGTQNEMVELKRQLVYEDAHASDGRPTRLYFVEQVKLDGWNGNEWFDV